MVLSDITARKQAEQALRSSEEKFRQLAENIHEVFWIMNAAGTEVLYISPAFESIWGPRSENPISRPADWMNNVHADYRAMSRDSFRRQLKGESTELSTEWSHRTEGKNGYAIGRFRFEMGPEN